MKCYYVIFTISSGKAWCARAFVLICLVGRAAGSAICAGETRTWSLE